MPLGQSPIGLLSIGEDEEFGAQLPAHRAIVVRPSRRSILANMSVTQDEIIANASDRSILARTDATQSENGD